jgi:hypothetical protein
MLFTVEVCETDAILSHLVHTWNNEHIQVESHGRKLHIAENLGALKIFIPKYSKDQEFCFLQHLPAKLFNEVMMGNKSGNLTRASDSEAVRIIAAIIMSRNETVHDLLDEADIISVPYPDGFDVEAYNQARAQVKPLIQHADHSQNNNGAIYLDCRVMM